MPERDLQAMRAEIDDLDHALLRLVARRREVVAELFDWKRARDIEPIDAARERALLDERRAAAEALDLPPGLAERLMRALLADSHARR